MGSGGDEGGNENNQCPMSNAQSPMPNAQCPMPNLRLSGYSIYLEPLRERLRPMC
ncbi:MAG: hypothetical protein V7L04_24605 [Nostoc sp.]|uniref:hypothetical protein n=1 Tax=Nostoc sp. TaxID=1180 RepID=UPI002FF631D5